MAMTMKAITRAKKNMAGTYLFSGGDSEIVVFKLRQKDKKEPTLQRSFQVEGRAGLRCFCF